MQHAVDRGRTRRLATIVFVAAVVTLASAVTAVASHQFSDVPDGHPFHDDITALADAGVTTGYGDGTFRPGATVTRQAVAAFTSRSSGRVALGAMPEAAINGDDPAALVGAVTVEPGATGSGNGFVLLSGTASAYSDMVGPCPCELAAVLVDIDTEQPINVSFFDLPGEATASGYASNSTSLQWVVPIVADQARTFALFVGVEDLDADDIFVFGELTGLYAPFGPDGGNQLFNGETAEPQTTPLDRGADRTRMPSERVFPSGEQ